LNILKSKPITKKQRKGAPQKKPLKMSYNAYKDEMVQRGYSKDTDATLV
jgi:hypothetical protein